MSPVSDPRYGTASHGKKGKMGTIGLSYTRSLPANNPKSMLCGSSLGSVAEIPLKKSSGDEGMVLEEETVSRYLP